MKKPTKEDLERIKNELREMHDYFMEIDSQRELTDSEINVSSPLLDSLDRIDDVLFYLPDIRENVVTDTKI